MVLKIVNANQSHSRDIWEWRNNPITRSVSKKTHEVKWNEHKAWFQKSLDNHEIFIYIGINQESQKNIPIGIIQSFEESARAKKIANILLLAKPHAIDWVQILKVEI